MKILHFTIYGTLQSWGERSSWNIRDSAEWPTKSGITGMICSALGYGYNDPRIGELCHNIQIGCKTKKEYSPQLNDFQTVDYFGGMLANGKREDRISQKTIVQNKYYIMDKKFLIAITAPDDILKQIQAAMLNPKWAMSLGRACCIPSQPIIPYIGDFGSIEDALRNVPLYDGIEEVMQIEADYGQRRTDVRAIGPDKKYEERYVVTKDI